ncbi:isocitrate lyase/phosphoenolpyruvate mutase family protein [Nocardiopsis sp. RSe5-2]|uniref:Isocitrate lyase/phosphoenolpyruvate mutase family protein n=1 Tax=Nocardiopsis endophytica TaxID=3018445 RepID=A0ABT4U618_9ACTN|nr:isocitrate lyase/phosphoenolpyruvate mutase family protein [Nocardiopsis endophytica]MDA2812392.1 isocitrate lyase/phosphoenolpyruvate mutase family protein [Nocardiopsis endophytica]
MHRHADTFRSLHKPGEPFVLPNAWDHVSAAALAGAGFPAIGTTSLGIAAAAGKPDAAGATRDETLALARGLARLDVPVTVDIEGGFGGRPDEVGALAAELASYGIAGVNLEDGRDDALAGVEEQCALLRAVKDAAPALFLNARTDTWWLSEPADERERVDATFERVRAYRDAGADGIFVPGLTDEAAIARLTRVVPLPLNVLAPRDPGDLGSLARAGVARVSTGSLLFRAAVHSAVETARAAASGTGTHPRVPGYAEVDSLADAFRDPSPAPVSQEALRP